MRLSIKSFSHRVLYCGAAMLSLLVMQGCEWFGEGRTDTGPLVETQGDVVAVQLPRVALDGNGVATVLHYEQTTRGTTHVSRLKASRYDLAVGAFGDQADLQVKNLASPDEYREPLLVSDQSGAAVAQVVDNHNTCRFVPTQGWSCTVSPTTSQALAMDGAGRVLSTGRTVPLTGSLIAEHFAQGVWGPEQVVASDKVDANASHDRAERDSLVYWSGGIGFAVWTDAARVVRASRFQRDSAIWESAVVLGTSRNHGPEFYSVPHVALARNAVNAGALAAWLNADNAIDYSRYVPGTGWQVSQTIAFTAANASPRTVFDTFELAMSGDGGALLIGRGPMQSTGPNTESGDILAMRYINGAWESPQVIGRTNSAAVSRPRVVMDGSGSGMAVWLEQLPTTTVPGKLSARRFDKQSGWEVVREVGSTSIAFYGLNTANNFPNGDAKDVAAFDVDMDAAGRAMIVWIGQAGPSLPLGNSRLRTDVTGLFRLDAMPSALALSSNGDNKVANVTVTRSAYAGTLSLRVLSCPAKVICSLGKTQLATGESDTTLTLLTSSADPASNGSYSVRVQAVGGPQTSEVAIAVTITGTQSPPPNVVLALNVNGGGRIVSSPAGLDCQGPQFCSGQFARNQVVTLTATPDAGQAFGGYGGDPDCSDGVLTLAFNASCAATFVVATGQWQANGGGALNVTGATSVAKINTPEMEMDNGGVPVVAFVENEKVVVRRFEGGTWQVLGAPFGAGSVGASSLTLDSSGAPVVAWEESDPQNTGSRNVFAARWDGTAWRPFGIDPADIDDSADAHSPCIRARSSDLAMTWVESSQQSGTRVVVRIWNGIAWSNAGATEGPPSTPQFQSFSPKLAVAPNDSLALGWADDFSTHVAELIGGAWTPTFAPLPPPSSGGLYMLDIAYSNAHGLLFVAQQNNGGTFDVRQWRSGAWSSLGSLRGDTALPGGNARIFGLAFSHGRTGSTPLLAYSRRNAAGSTHEFVVDRFSAADWVRVGNPIGAFSRHNQPGFELLTAVADGAIPRVVTQVIGSLPNTGARDDSLLVYRFL